MSTEQEWDYSLPLEKHEEFLVSLLGGEDKEKQREASDIVQELVRSDMAVQVLMAMLPNASSGTKTREEYVVEGLNSVNQMVHAAAVTAEERMREARKSVDALRARVFPV